MIAPKRQNCDSGRQVHLEGKMATVVAESIKTSPNTSLPRGRWNHRGVCQRTDKPVAGLLRDLAQRGLLDSTLVIWGGEFGRTPTTQKSADGFSGRDHNMQAFTSWMAGGGIKGGTTYGKTDDFGHAVVEDPVSVHDFHATILHLLGLDHQQLFFTRSGLEERLTGVEPPRVVREIIA